MTGLEAGKKSEFDDNIDKCASWDGSFSSRRKREANGIETENEKDAAVPSVMEKDSGALGWLKSAIRKVRSAEPQKGKGNKNNTGKRKGKRGRKGNKNNGKGKGKGKG